MAVVAEICPNCGAPLSLEGDRCKFCHVPVVIEGRPPDAPSVAPPAPSAARPGDPNAPFALTVDDVFSIAKRGTVVTGRVACGSVRVGDDLVIDGAGGSRRVRCTGVEKFRKKHDVATAGETVGLLLDGVDKTGVVVGDRLRHA
jgi:translation elongation factor EF-1alpha